PSLHDALPISDLGSQSSWCCSAIRPPDLSVSIGEMLPPEAVLPLEKYQVLIFVKESTYWFRVTPITFRWMGLRPFIGHSMLLPMLSPSMAAPAGARIETLWVESPTSCG